HTHAQRQPYGAGSRGDGGTIVPLIVPCKSHLVFSMPRMGQTILAMKAMQLLASSGVMAAAGAMISLTFAVSPPLTLLPPRPVPVDVNGKVMPHQRPMEAWGAVAPDLSERRGEAPDDIPPIPPLPREEPEGVISGLRLLPMPQDAPPVTPRRDPLEGL